MEKRNRKQEDDELNKHTIVDKETEIVRGWSRVWRNVNIAGKRTVCVVSVPSSI